MTFADDNQPLFHDNVLKDQLASFEPRIITAVNELPENEILNEPKETLINQMVSKFAITPLEIFEDQITANKKEDEVDVSHDSDRNLGHEGTGPLMVPSLRVILDIPFSGSIGLWKLKPSQSQTSFPRGNVQRSGDKSGKLVLVINEPIDAGPEKFQRLKEDTLKDVRFFIEKQKADIEQFNTNIPNIVVNAINERREKLQTQEDIIAALGLPTNSAEDAPKIDPLPEDGEVSQNDGDEITAATKQPQRVAKARALPLVGQLDGHHICVSSIGIGGGVVGVTAVFIPYSGNFGRNQDSLAEFLEWEGAHNLGDGEEAINSILGTITEEFHA